MSRALTVVAEVIDKERRDQVAAALATIRDDVARNYILCPDQIPATHFTRWLILRDHATDDPHPDLLVWESNYDGDPNEYLEAVVAAVPAGLDQVFGCCVGYPSAGAAAAPEEVVSWLRAHARRAQAFYCAYRGITRKAVVNDIKVRAALGKIVDDDRAALVQVRPDEVHRRVRERLAADQPELDTADDGDGETRIFLGRVIAGIGLAAVTIALLPVWIAIYLLVRRAEIKDRDATRVDRPVHHGRHPFFEDRVMQNQLTHIVDIKPGVLRLVAVWLVLNAIGVLAAFFYVNGALQGMTTIHFARWVILYDTRPERKLRRHRVVFFSNYDGSWDAYLGEFIDRGASGLTAIWSNTEGFPTARWLFGDGARDEESFKQWARERQRPVLDGEAQAWWSGVPSYTVANVRDNAWVRRRINRRLDDEEVAEWLRKL